MPSAISQQVLGLATATSPGLAQAGGYNILPAGIVFPYAGGSAPAGFIICDGSQYLKTDYPSLYAAIGNDYATQINTATGLAWGAPDADKFRVPDYRGIFLRGVGTPSGLDTVTRGAQQVDKTKKNGLAATSSTPSVSGTTNINHTHNASSVSGTVNIAHTHGASTVAGLQWASRGYGYGAENTQNRWDDRYNYGGENAASAGGQSLGTTNVDIAVGSAGGQTLTGSTNTPALTGTVSTPTITVGTGDNETRPINKGVNYIIKA